MILGSVADPDPEPDPDPEGSETLARSEFGSRTKINVSDF
jgi:hypothetical protein